MSWIPSPSEIDEARDELATPIATDDREEVERMARWALSVCDFLIPLAFEAERLRRDVKKAQ